MSKRPLGIVLLVVFAIGLVVAITLVSGEGAFSSPDRKDDVAFEDRPGRPDDEQLADIIEARVSRDGDELEFRSRMAKTLPKELDRGALEWRWEIHEDGELTWILTATVDLEANASLISTQTQVTRSTVDGSLPGGVAVTDDRLAITLKPDELRGFPSSFRWHLIASLDANRANPETALAYDHAPDRGTEGFTSD